MAPPGLSTTVAGWGLSSIGPDRVELAQRAAGGDAADDAGDEPRCPGRRPVTSPRTGGHGGVTLGSRRGAGPAAMPRSPPGPRPPSPAAPGRTARAWGSARTGA